MTPATQATIDAAAFILRQLFNRATDPALTYGEIETTVDGIARRFDAAGLKAVARAFGCTYGLTSKAATRQRIVNRISERKGRHERGEAIAAIAWGDAWPGSTAQTPHATDNATGRAS